MHRHHILRRSFSLWNRRRGPSVKDIYGPRVQPVRFVKSASQSSAWTIGLTLSAGFQWWLYDSNRETRAKRALEEEAAAKNSSPTANAVVSQEDATRPVRDADGFEYPTDDADVDDDADDVVHLDDDSVIWSIPLGSPRPKPRGPYNVQTDPNYHKFVAFTHKWAAHEIPDIKKELALMTAEAVRFRDEHGQPVAADKCAPMVEFQFPARPATEYERLTLARIKDTSGGKAIVLGWFDVDIDDVYKAQNADARFMAAALALREDVLVKAKTAWENARTLIGWQTETMRKKEAFSSLFPPPPPSAPPTASPSPNPSLPSPTPAPSVPALSAPSSSSQQPQPPQQPPREQSQLPLPTPLNALIPHTLPSATNFLPTYHRAYAHIDAHLNHFVEAPPGCFYVNGRVVLMRHDKVRGRHERLYVEVRAIYDIEKRRYVHSSYVPVQLGPFYQGPWP